MSGSKEMKESEYLAHYYPQDFICIADAFYPLPKGGQLSIEDKEVSTTFTTADGSKRKDIIRRYKAVSIKYNLLTQEDYESLSHIIEQIESAFYDEGKYLYLKKERMPPIAPPDAVRLLFERITIDTVQPKKMSYRMRKNGCFLYEGLALKFN